MIVARRSFVTGLGAMLAAPAIVKAEGLMRCAPTEIIRPDYGLRIGDTLRIRLPHDFCITDGPPMDSQDYVITSVYMGRDEALARYPSAQDSGAIRGLEYTQVWYDEAKDLPFPFAPVQKFPGPLEQPISTALGVAALAVAAAPVIGDALQKPVSRRFWGK